MPIGFQAKERKRIVVLRIASQGSVGRICQILDRLVCDVNRSSIKFALILGNGLRRIP